MAITATTVRLIRSTQYDALSSIREADGRLVEAWAASWQILAPRVSETLLEYLVANETWPTRAEMRRRRPLTTMFTAISREAADLALLAEKEIAATAQGVAERAAAAQFEIIASQLPAAWRPELMETEEERRLSSAINRAARRAGTLTRRIPTMIDRAMRRTIAQGATGARPESAVRRMISRLSGSYGTGLTSALTILGTETMDAHRRGSRAGALGNAEVIDGWIWTARLARNTCAACLALHGSVHPLDEPGPDGHPRCRCIRTPKTKTWKELGINIGLDDPDEPADMIADARAFFRSLSRADKLKIMGPTRLRLLERGEIEWEDLAMVQQSPFWRRSYVMTPVHRLER